MKRVGNWGPVIETENRDKKAWRTWARQQPKMTMYKSQGRVRWYCETEEYDNEEEKGKIRNWINDDAPEILGVFIGLLILAISILCTQVFLHHRAQPSTVAQSTFAHGPCGYDIWTYIDGNQPICRSQLPCNDFPGVWTRFNTDGSHIRIMCNTPSDTGGAESGTVNAGTDRIMVYNGTTNNISIPNSILYSGPTQIAIYPIHPNGGVKVRHLAVVHSDGTLGLAGTGDTSKVNYIVTYINGIDTKAGIAVSGEAQCFFRDSRSNARGLYVTASAIEAGKCTAFQEKPKDRFIIGRVLDDEITTDVAARVQIAPPERPTQ